MGIGVPVGVCGVGVFAIGVPPEVEVLGAGLAVLAIGDDVSEVGVPDPFGADAVHAVIAASSNTVPTQPCQARRVRPRFIHRGYPADR